MNIGVLWVEGEVAGTTEQKHQGWRTKGNDEMIEIGWLGTKIPEEKQKMQCVNDANFTGFLLPSR